MVDMALKLCDSYWITRSTIRILIVLKHMFLRITSDLVNSMKNWATSKKVYGVSPCIKMVDTRIRSVMLS